MIPCRFAVHVLSDGTKHIDLFVSVEEDEDLLSFEISDKYIPHLEKIFHEKNCPEFTAADHPVDSNSIPLNIKKPHRRIYMDFEGAIQPDRGTLSHLGKGFFKKISKKSRFLSHV